MNKMLATNFLPYHCCLSAADDNMEKRNISGYLSVDLTECQNVSLKTKAAIRITLKRFSLSIDLDHTFRVFNGSRLGH